MPEETNALKDKVFDDDDYVSQVRLVHQDTKAMLDMALGRFESGGIGLFTCRRSIFSATCCGGIEIRRG